MLKKNVKAMYPTYISTTMMEVNAKSLEKSANPRHMILFKMFQTISFYSFLFSIRGNDSEQCQNTIHRKISEQYDNWIDHFNQHLFFFKWSHLFIVYWKCIHLTDRNNNWLVPHFIRYLSCMLIRYLAIILHAYF